MKIISIRLVFLILIMSAGCGRDLEQSKRYFDMKSECDTLIAQASLVISAQKVMIDSLRKIRDRNLRVNAQKYKLQEIDRKITNAVEIESNIENVRNHLMSIKDFAENGEKATKKLFYYKRKYMTYATVIQVHDENIMIQEITDGLTAKQYISRYLQKEKK